MKYKYNSNKIDKETRTLLNDKILRLLPSKDVSQQDVYNYYTGIGGLHDLDFKDFNSYHDFSEEKKNIEQGQFFTPPKLAHFLISLLDIQDTNLVADLTFGKGDFFNFIKNNHNCYGTEIDQKAYKVAKYLYPEANLENKNILHYNPEQLFDVVVGNPPFNIKLEDEDETYESQFYYFKKAYELMKPGALLAIIVPSSFINDEFFFKSKIEFINDRFSFLGQYGLDSNVFKNLGVTNYSTKIMFFYKNSENLQKLPYSTTITNINIDNDSALLIYNNILKSYRDNYQKQKQSINLEIINERLNDFEHYYQFKLKKYLFEIKTHKHLRSHYPSVIAYIKKYNEQKQPDDVTAKEWLKIRITPNKILSKLKKLIKNQNKVSEDKIEIVKTNYGLKLKAYSNKMKHALSKYETKSISFNEYVRTKVLPSSFQFFNNNYLALLERKVKENSIETQDYNEMSRNEDVDKFLNNIKLYKATENQYVDLFSPPFDIVQPNIIQKHDLGLMFQKKYGNLCWQQGGGKTLAGILFSLYNRKKRYAKFSFIVSSSLSINVTWKERLRAYDLPFIVIDKIEDCQNLHKHKGKFILITFNKVIILQKHLKKALKINGYKSSIFVDESDDASNPTSKTTKSLFSVFVRLKYKMNATGTLTRNYVIESYPQLRFLYNNSFNMMDFCMDTYKEAKDHHGNKFVKELRNQNYGNTYSGYNGYGKFKNNFNPSKKTVFGIGKHNQDIYNIEEYKRIINYSTITRTLVEIKGRKDYKINTIKINMSALERESYNVILNEFRNNYKLYFNTTGNSRKDSMLMLIMQINSLIKAAEAPHLMPNYKGDEYPTKYYEILSKVNKYEKQIAIGVTYKDSAKSMHEFLSKHIKDRNIYYIDGDITMKNRKNIIYDKFKPDTSGILISTQQSLSKSVSIPFCDYCIINGMQWNYPRMSQYYFRFIRFDSDKFKKVEFITSDQTIEQNLLALLLTKEKQNEFVKSGEIKNFEYLFDEYGVEENLFDNIFSKDTDQEGNVKLNWGKQKTYD